MEFVYEPAGSRIVFAPGALDRAADELDRLGARRVLVLATPGRADAARALADRLGGRACGALAIARVHVPEAVAAEAVAAARRLEADATIGFGGGSAIGLGKAVALELGLPQLAIPTTYAGSEMTPVWGITAAGAKRTGRDPRVQPRAVIYDPRLTLDLPARVTAASGINALAHAAEAMYAAGAPPVTAVLAEEAVRALAAALPAAARDGRDLDARAGALYGAYLAGSVLGTTPMGLHHQLCHALGGAFDLPHAELHALVLPHVLRFNAPAAPVALARLARALDAGDGDGAAPAALARLVRALGLPTTLAALGVPRAGLPAIARRVADKPYPNPRPIDEASVLRLLEDMFTEETL